MDHFSYAIANDSSEPIASLTGEGIPIGPIADRFGTPLFVYSSATMLDHADRFKRAFAAIDPQICYAVKACSNPQILRRLFSTGHSGAGLGADVVSGLELERAWVAGCPMDRVVFAGVGKSDDEIRAALDGRFSPLRSAAAELGLDDPTDRGPVGILNAESRSELERIGAIAEELGQRARVAIRVNPDIDAGAHDHTTTGRAGDKFGVPPEHAAELCEVFASTRAIQIVGFHMHLGSPIYAPDPYLRGIRVVTELIERVSATGTCVTHFDLGGGFGADYETGQTPPYNVFADAMIPALRPLVSRGIRIALEPGRTIMGNAGILVVTVRHVKRQSGRRFVICDAGMNALIRPALYGAQHFVWPLDVTPQDVPDRRSFDRYPTDDPCDIVGPVCETGDFIARGVRLPEVRRGDRLAVFTAGAYAMTMASTYNDQPLPAEALIEGGQAELIRERQRPAETLGLSCTPAAASQGSRA